MPTFPGMGTFKGQMLHSTQYKRALDLQGKKVVVVGACTSGMSRCVHSPMFVHAIDIFILVSEIPLIE